MHLPKYSSLLLLAFCVSAKAFALPRTTSLVSNNRTSQYSPATLHNDDFHSLRAGDLSQVENTSDPGDDKGNPLVSFLFSALGLLRRSAFTLLSTTARVLFSIAAWISEQMTGGPLIPQTGSFVYGDALGGNESLTTETLNLAVQERSLIVTESMYVECTEGHYCKVKGIRGILTGRDRMRFSLKGKQVAYIESKNKSVKYWIHRGTKNDERIGWIEKKEKKKRVTTKNGPKYDVDFAFYPQPDSVSSENTTEPVQPKAAYTLDGDFINRNYVMRNDKGEVCAKIKKRLIAFPAFDHYVVRIAAGMDPIMVLACTCVVDEELEEEIKDKIANTVKSAASSATLFIRDLFT